MFDHFVDLSVLKAAIFLALAAMDAKLVQPGKNSDEKNKAYALKVEIIPCFFLCGYNHSVEINDGKEKGYVESQHLNFDILHLFKFI